MYIVFTFNLSLPARVRKGLCQQFRSKVKRIYSFARPLCAEISRIFLLFRLLPFSVSDLSGKAPFVQLSGKRERNGKVVNYGWTNLGKMKELHEKMQIFPKTARKRCRILRNLHEFDAILVNLGKSR